MKKRIKIIGLIFIAVPLLVWCIPLLIARTQTEQLEGSFLVGHCACKHEIFYLIEDGKAYDFCPGHKEKKLIGAVVTLGNHLTAYRGSSGTSDFELKLEGSVHYLRFPNIKENEWFQVEQINNPWRTSLRSYFPE